MGSFQPPKIDPCVAAWLYDARQVCEMECTAILLAKSILPPRCDSSMTTIEYPNGAGCGNLKREKSREIGVVRPSVQQTHTPELILSGKIEITDYHEPEKPAYQFGNLPRCAENDSKINTKDSLQRCHAGSSSTYLEYDAKFSPKDSFFSDSSAGSQQTMRSYSEKRLENSIYIGHNTNGDRDSLDSACGSSPVNSYSQNNSPVRTNSPASNSLSRSNLLHSHSSGVIFTPSYSDLQDVISRALEVGSQLYSHLNSSNSSSSQKMSMVNSVEEMLALAENSYSGAFLPYEDWLTVKNHLRKMRQDEQDAQLEDEFCTTVKGFVAKLFVYFAKVILRELTEVGWSGGRVDECLSQLAHLALFGEEISLEIIQVRGINSVVVLIKQNPHNQLTTRLGLRVLAVLCSVSKGCVQLLSIGGLDLIVRILSDAPFVCAVEAAGVLAQLTAPCHSFSALPPTLPKVVVKLLDLSDKCEEADKYLLCIAAVANLSMQNSSVSDQLYKHNAVLRIARAHRTPKARSIFVQDQLASIFARLSANGFNEALIAQGSIDCLLSFLQVRDPRHKDICKRIQYKSAICLGTIASKGNGLKAIYDNNGYEVLRKTRQNCGSCRTNSNPLDTICKSLMSRLEAKYSIETEV